MLPILPEDLVAFLRLRHCEVVKRWGYEYAPLADEVGLILRLLEIVEE